MKKPPPPQHSGSDGYGYGNYGGYGTYGYGAYSGYYYGYGGYGYPGGGGGGEPHPTRTLRDYLLILRERIWYLIVTFFVIFTACVLYALNKTPVYTSAATVQVLREKQEVLPGPVDTENRVASTEDFNTRVRLMESMTIANAVADRLRDQDRKNFMAPYENAFSLGPPLTIQQRLLEGRSVEPMRQSLMIAVSFTHPNKEIAAEVANYFAEEFIANNERINADTAMKLVDDLNQRASQQRRRVEEISTSLNDMIRKYGDVALDKENDIKSAELKQQDEIVTDDQRTLDASKERWSLVQQQQQSGQPLWNLSFIAGQARVAELLGSYGNAEVQLTSLEKKFGERHPDIIQLHQTEDQLKQELTDAVTSASQTVYTDYLAAQSDYQQAVQNRDDIQKDIIEMSQVQVNYNTLLHDQDVADNMYKAILSSVEEEQAQFNLTAPMYRIVDHAGIPGDPSSPHVMAWIVGGLVAGVALGVVMAFLVAFLDDRVKTAFDIESVVGLPLLGIIPRIRHLNSSEKAQAVATNTDRRVTESFRSIYSTLKLNDASKNARAILVTSTVPSEGKSFVTTNLALTYALHGERVLIIDCDLRMPNIAKSLGQENLERGLLTHLVEKRPLEECMVKDIYPNMDLLATGGKTRNPTQIFNSREFADFMTHMRQQYDRIFIDSPPVGAVSDALNLLPNVDGVLYIIKFNSVKRKTAKLNIRRLLEGNVPIFGAILNQISLSVASYYYTSYYDKSYRNYYVHDDDDQLKEPSVQPAAARAETGDERPS
jgi:capsular exopolysaccharide synthesis family protein